MIRLALFLVLFWAHLLALIPNRLRVARMERRGRVDEARRAGQVQAVRWARQVLKMAGVSVVVKGALPARSDGKGCLVVSNHQSAFDIPLLAGYLGQHSAFVAKIELSKVPLLGRWIQLAGGVFLDRSDRRQSLEVAKQAISRLQDGVNMVIFPEGTRSNSAQMRAFKKGSASIAVKAGVPIVPVTICHSWRLLDTKNFRLKPGRVELIIHPEIDPRGLSKEELDGISENIQRIIAEPLEEDLGGAACNF